MSPSASTARALFGAFLVLCVEATLLAIGLGDPGALVRDPRAAALLVIWGVAGFAMTLTRPPRAPGAAKTEFDPLPMLGLVVVPLVTPVFAALAARFAIAIPPYANTLSWCGVAVVALGLWLRAASMARLGARFSPVVALQPEHTLETGGPYAHVRHPGYTGALLTCAGNAVAFGSLAALPLVLLMALAIAGRVRREEALLARAFGEQWTAYAARTGALLPRPGR